jgi:hypothetical protein
VLTPADKTFWRCLPPEDVYASVGVAIGRVLIEVCEPEIPAAPETWPIIEHEPEHIPDVPPDLRRKQTQGGTP